MLIFQTILLKSKLTINRREIPYLALRDWTMSIQTNHPCYQILIFHKHFARVESLLWNHLHRGEIFELNCDKLSSPLLARRYQKHAKFLWLFSLQNSMWRKRQHAFSSLGSILQKMF